MRAIDFSRPRRSLWLVGGVFALLIVVPSASGSSSSVQDRVRPIIASFAPTSGSVGTQVTITGNHFLIGNVKVPTVPVGAVRFGGAAALKWRVKSNTTIIATVPKGARTGKISVLVPATTNTDATAASPAETASSRTSFTVSSGG